jgi:hypothetical protein
MYDDKPALVAAIRALANDMPDTFTIDEPLIRLDIPELSITGWHRSAVIAAFVDSHAHLEGRKRFTFQRDYVTYVRVPDAIVPACMMPPVNRNYECRDCGRRVYCGAPGEEAQTQCAICQRREWIAIMIAEEDRLFTRD